ncbi:hypothetical protein I6F35_08875 [Bradyrhizobium sp. BRP22]|uniref:hypothetical protein n=1 Tax=Bradyrhizobium sp. BRP22 TaxID=2793821 RepID=UPI001CD75431|nr:hypothetical protein [Bradyrhizobium sp. BRP22]MCA1453326.1 hypothetical protein [Bradyrhizobium sp. BRP22]
MESTRLHNAQSSVLLSLEAAAATARGGFGCLFSSSDEYETALIAERRAQGRYGRPRSAWPMMMFLGLTLMVVGTVLVFS